MRKRKYRYKLIQNGTVVASVESVNKKQAETDIKHYVLIYSQYGEVKIKPALSHMKRVSVW